MSGVETMSACDTRIRWMIHRDLAEVLEIEQLCFEYPRSEAVFARTLRRTDVACMVLEDDGQVNGFLFYALCERVVHVWNLAVHPDVQRNGVGSRLIEDLVGRLRRLRRDRIEATIRESNVPAQLFFREMGFQAVAIVRDFYEETDEDAYVFRYEAS